MTQVDNPEEIKSAKLLLKLKADSGYSCDTEYRISAHQWNRIIAICENGEQAKILAAAPELLRALERFAHYPAITCQADYEIARAAIAKAKGET